MSLSPNHLSDICSHMQSGLVGIQIGKNPAIIQEKVKDIGFLHATAVVNAVQPAATKTKKKVEEKAISADSVVAVAVPESVASMAADFL